MRTRRGLVGACALFAVVYGCSGGSGKANPPPTTTVAASSTKVTAAPSSSSTTTTTIAAPGPSLDSLILKEAPSRFPRKPDQLADTGPTDLEKAAFDDVLSPDAHQVLVDSRFLRGYQRQWATRTAYNFVFLYQFATREGAQAYVEHWRATIADANSGVAPVPFTPALVPGAIGLLGSDKVGSSGVALFAKGRYAVQTLVTGAASVDQSLPVSALALAQYELLPGPRATPASAASGVP